MKHFFRKLDQIDSIIQGGASRGNAASIVALMTDPASTFYVLDKIDGSWLESLESIGYFRDLASGNGRSEDVPQAIWPASAYLKRIASDARTNIDLARAIERVLSLILGPGNFYTFRDIVDTSLLLPREMRRGVVPFIQRAIGNRLSVEFSNITTLIVTLAEEGEIAAAIRLFASVFSIFPSSNQHKGRKYTLNPGASSFMDSWHYKEQLAKCVPTLARVAGLRFLSCISKLLIDFIRLDISRPEFQGPDDLSYIWRPAVEDHAQNINDDARDSLVTAIRECAEIIASRNPESFGAVTEFLDSQQWFIFTRVLLFLLSDSPTAPINLIVHYSTQPYLFSEVTVRHEYSLLLKKRFHVLTEEQQNVVLRMIENGPDRQSYVRAVTQVNTEPPSEEEIQAYVGRWKLDWFSFIADDLQGDWMSFYKALQDAISPPSHPEFPYFVSSTFGLVGGHLNTAPLSSSSADSDMIDEVINRLLQDRIKGSELSGIESDRLTEELKAAAVANPQIVLRRIDEIATLHPARLAAIFPALLNCTSGTDNSLMSPLLRIAVTVAKSIRETEDAPEREGLRSSLTSVLDQFFSDDSRPLEAEHLQYCLEIAETLLATVTLSSGQQAYAGSEDFDPLFWAINSTDGRIVENAIKVALRDRKLQGDVDSVEPQWLLNGLSHLLAIMPNDEVRITAILGYRFPWLVHLSRAWATKNAEGIFPRSPDCRWRWEAAWCTYVGFSGAYNDVLEILKNQYADAVSEVSTKHAFKKSRYDPDQGLAQHLAIYYWRQLISLQHPLLTDFLALGGERPVKSFISHIGRGMSNVNDIPSRVTDSLRLLAEWMVSVWKPQRKNARKALSALGWWFPHTFLGDADWRLRILRNAVKRAKDLDNIDQVLKDLDQLASERPALVVDCLKCLTNGAHGESSAYFLASHSVGILEKAVISANVSTRAKISDIANYFGAKGHFEYRRFA